jgi:tyrosine-protein kinase Etk/Wzc
MSERVRSGYPEDAPTTQSSPAEDEFSLLDLLIVLAKHKRIVLGVPFVAAVLAVPYSLSLPNIYSGTTRILPPQQSASAASALLSQLGGTLGGIVGAAGGGLGLRNPNDLYVGMLRSRTVTDNMIARFDLNNVYRQELQSNTRNALQGSTSIAAGRDGIITIEVDDKDPKRAAELANAYVDELMKFTRVLAVTEASQRRLFFERQLLQVKDNLTAAEVAARQGLQKGGLAQVDAQGRSMIEVTARLRAQVSVKEVQISSMRTFAAEGNPELQRTQQELEALKRELGRVEGSSPIAAFGKGDATGNTGLDNLGRLRNVKYYEFLYELLAKQYELAKIDEAKDATIIQVMDQAIEPDRKSKPKRAQIVLFWAFLALIASILWVIIREATARTKANPVQASRLEALRGYLRWKHPAGDKFRDTKPGPPVRPG